MGGGSSKPEASPEEQVATELYKDTITTIQEIWKDMRSDPSKEHKLLSRFTKLFTDNPEYRKLFVKTWRCW
eukprot:TRINITY_DN10531_c0_g1_i1.p2 TRINITY_DN10531_c0_g1~~TRINITY_DN10531_c0_g1_i1.p2  ORF type:complete len:71 (-),score=12.60 TRINITY_DN10531_c0_g1_i1:78-290(-)